jgi:hypothetical protein
VVVNEPLGVNHLGGNLALAQNRHALARQHRPRQRPHLGRVGVRLDKHKRRVAHRLNRRTALAAIKQRTHPFAVFAHDWCLCVCVRFHSDATMIAVDAVNVTTNATALICD